MKAKVNGIEINYEVTGKEGAPWLVLSHSLACSVRMWDEQIAAFRALTIPDVLQEQYGYPALTDELKAKILGLNAAKLYGVDPQAVRCTVGSCG